MSRSLRGNDDISGVCNISFFSAPSTRVISRCLEASPRLPFMHARVWSRCVVFLTIIAERTLIDRCCCCYCCCYCCLCSSQLANVFSSCMSMCGAAVMLFSGTAPAPALAATASMCWP